jgi:hypothetical protein
LSADTRDRERRARREMYFILLVFGRYCKFVTCLIFFLVDMDESDECTCLYSLDLGVEDCQEI